MNWWWLRIACLRLSGTPNLSMTHVELHRRISCFDHHLVLGHLLLCTLHTAATTAAAPLIVIVVVLGVGSLLTHKMQAVHYQDMYH